jgi:hypothetical protein
VCKEVSTAAIARCENIPEKPKRIPEQPICFCFARPEKIPCVTACIIGGQGIKPRICQTGNELQRKQPRYPVKRQSTFLKEWYLYNYPVKKGNICYKHKGGLQWHGSNKYKQR